MRFGVVALCGLCVTGCAQPDQYEFGGTTMFTLFPFDGLRSWEFINTEDTVSYKLLADMHEEPEEKGVTNIYVVDYTVDCVQDDDACINGERLRTVKWSSESTEGVKIHSYDVDGTEIEMKPPLQVASGSMKKDDVVTTKIGSTTWTATLLGFDFCPVHMNVDWKDCAHIVVDDGDGDDLTGYPIAGEYWAIAGFNVVAVDLTAEPGRWELSAQECEGECDGEW